MLRFQDCIYPANFVKMRCVENHDQPRIMKLAPGRAQALAWTAFAGLQPRRLPHLRRAGIGRWHTPSLFDIDKVEWGNYELQPFLTRLARLKKDPAQVAGQLVLLSAEPAIQAAWNWADARLYGVFNVSAVEGSLPCGLPNGVVHTDLLSDETIRVQNGNMTIPAFACILRYEGDLDLRPSTPLPRLSPACRLRRRQRR